MGSLGSSSSFTSSSSKAVRKFLRSQFKSLVFRRVVDVTVYGEIEGLLYYPSILSPSEEIQLPLGQTRAEEFTPLEVEKNVEFRCRSYTALTSGRPIRLETPDTYHIPIRCPSENYAEIDMSDSFWFTKSQNTKYVVPPRKGDLVCGLVGNNRKTGKPLEYSFWFTCSEQFLRAWTLIMFNEHCTFDKNEEQTYKWVMSGNRLCTNSYLKWRLSLQGEPPLEELDDRFYHLRTEKTSKEWVHIYASLVLVARYGQIPSKVNVPVNLDGGPVMKNWHIPPHFVTNLLRLSGCRLQTSEK